MKKIFFTVTAVLCGIVDLHSAHDYTQFTPTEVVELYYRSQGTGDIATLKNIMVLDAKISEDKIIRRDVQGLAKEKELVFLVSYEKIINDHTAEIGVTLGKIPSVQVRLVKDNNVWKIKDFYQLSAEELIDALKDSPTDANLWYYAGRRALVAGNPYKSALCNQKYLELAGDNNFWLTPMHVIKMKSDLNFDQKIKSTLASYNGAKNDDGKCRMGRLLAILYLEVGNYEKAQEVINEVALPKYQKWNQWKDTLIAELKERQAGKKSLDTIYLWIKESAKKDIPKR